MRALMVGTRAGLLGDLASRLNPFGERRPGGRQATLRHPAPFPEFKSYGDLLAWLDERDVTYEEGGWTVYLPPQPGLRGTLGEWVNLYPDDAGFKILKDLRPTEEARYMPFEWRGWERSPASTWMQSAISGTAEAQILPANVLYMCDVGPRLYDVFTLEGRSALLTVFVVQHVAGGAPSSQECAEMLARIDAMVESGRASIVLDDWKQHKDFRPPSCNGNAVRSERTARTLYVDFQNFLVPNRRRLIRSVVSGEAKRELHWGREYLIKGRRYLYQSVPQAAATGRRDSARRWDAIVRLLRATGFDLQGRLVLDIGCNAGMMMGNSLAGGAHWALGWDRAAVGRCARDLMLALGYTRFDVFGAELVRDYPLRSDIPTHLTPLLPDSVVFYLAMRRHIGFLRQLGDIPWRLMIYEGGEMETVDTLRDFLEDLSTLCEFKIAAVRQFRDSETGARPLAVLVRDG